MIAILVCIYFLLLTATRTTTLSVELSLLAELVLKGGQVRGCCPEDEVEGRICHEGLHRPFRVLVTCLEDETMPRQVPYSA